MIGYIRAGRVVVNAAESNKVTSPSMHAYKRSAPWRRRRLGNGRDANASQLARAEHATIDKQARQGVISAAWQLCGP